MTWFYYLLLSIKSLSLYMLPVGFLHKVQLVSNRFDMRNALTLFHMNCLFTTLIIIEYLLDT
jgi:hypothetical protein